MSSWLHRHRHHRRPLSLLSLLLLLLLQPTHSIDFNNPNNRKACTPWKCTKKDHIPVPKRRLNLEAGGCSDLTNSMGGSFGTQGHELLLEPCCNSYQACLGICGMRDKTCFSDFVTCMDTTCSKQTKKDAIDKCKQDQGLYKMLVNIGDCKKFTLAQHDNCRCVPEEKVDKKRKELLMDFWKKHNAKKKKTGKDADKLLQKYNATPKKFAKLIYKLVKKYPKAIKRSTKQNAMEEMIKRATRGENMRTPGGGASKEKINPEQRAQDFKEKTRAKPPSQQENVDVVEEEEEDDEDTLNLDEM